MTKVVTSDLEMANSSAGLQMLESNIESANNVSRTISDSITSMNENFKGEAYAAARSKLGEYIILFKKQSELCKELVDGIKSANNYMIGYMAGDEVLNDRIIASLEKEIDDVKFTLNHLPKPACPEDNGADSKAAYEAAQAEYERTKAEYEAIIAELEAYLEKLKGLAPADSAARGMISSAEDMAISYGQSVNGINV